MPVEPSGRLLVMEDWITGPNWLVYDALANSLQVEPSK